MRLSDFLARAWKLANDKARELGLVSSASADGRATFAGNYNYLARVACNTLSQGPYDYHWHAGPKALTVKTTVPTPCTPPFPKNQQAKRPLRDAWFGGCQPTKSLWSNPEAR